jgi:hypothetical protein
MKIRRIDIAVRHHLSLGQSGKGTRQTRLSGTTFAAENNDFLHSATSASN